MKMAPKVWYLSPDADTIQEITLEHSINHYLHCNTIDAQCFQPDPNTQYAVYYDDNGMYADTAFNSVAHNILSRIKIWWGTYNGWFMIVKNVYDENGNETTTDMDISLDEFIRICNSTIRF